MVPELILSVNFYTPLGDLDYRVVHYRLVYAQYSKVISVVVSAKEMNNTDDLAECKTRANEKVCIEKNQWISDLANPNREEEVSDLNGSVSL